MHIFVLQTMDGVQGRVLLSLEAGWEERPGLEHPGGAVLWVLSEETD